ncbi:MAG: 50S ribosomal protein L10 [Acidimicrobiia bacterium]|nr:50S ribosomal protein L10 [Acidimicrobiia bacterium]
MARPEKVQAVSEIKERMESADAVFAAEYAGLSVKQQQELRRGLRGSDAEFKVVKMTLARRASDELALAEFDEFLVGPTGLTFANDAVSAAKVLAEFAKANDGLVIKGGLLGGDVLSADRVGELAKIDSLEVLLAKLAGAIKAPLSKVAGMLAALPRNTASAFQQLLDKKESEAPAPEAPAAEAAADEVAAEEPAAEEPAAEEPAAEESATEVSAADSSDAAETEEAEAPAQDSADEVEPKADAAADDTESASGDDEDEATDSTETTDDEEPATAAEEE